MRMRAVVVPVLWMAVGLLRQECPVLLVLLAYLLLFGDEWRFKTLGLALSWL